MGLLDRIAGRSSQQEQQAQQQEEKAVPSTTSSSELLHDIAPHVGGLPSAPHARLYDPYEGISMAVGGRPHAFQLPEGPEFVFQEEAAVKRRGWGENLQFYTGIGYLGGE